MMRGEKMSPPAIILRSLNSNARCATRLRVSLRFLLVLCGCLFLLFCARMRRRQADDTIVVGSKNFTEQIVLAELFAQQIEAHSALHVERRVNLGGTLICHQALARRTNRSVSRIYGHGAHRGSERSAAETIPRPFIARVQAEYRARFQRGSACRRWASTTRSRWWFAETTRQAFTCKTFPTSCLTRRNGAPVSATNSWSGRTDIAAWRRPTACILPAIRRFSISACSTARLRTSRWTSWPEIPLMA